MFLYMDRTGFINIFLKTIDIENQKFLGSTTQAMACIAVVLLWINIAIILSCFYLRLKDIPESYYEAAKLDGANNWNIFWRITFPLLKPTSI